MLRGKERKKRKKEQICKDKEYLYTLKINCKRKRTVGKANKGINVEKNIIGLNKLKIKIKKRKTTELQKPNIEADVYNNNKNCI